MKKFDWKGDDYHKKVVAHFEGNLDAAAAVLESSIVQSFGHSGVTGTRSGATREDRHANRSTPGDPPNVDTGRLKNSIGWAKAGRLRRKVGSGIGGKRDPGYAFYLEFGTRRMAARPFLRPAVVRNRATLAKIISRPL